jgi:ribonuclease HII
MVNLNKEKELQKKGYKIVVGLDEAGRGPLAGPVVASAIYVNPALECSRFDLEQMKDSKKLSAKQRDKFYDLLTNNPNIKWGIGMVSEKVIDKINILEATKLAMLKAIQNLEAKMKEAKPLSHEAGAKMKEAKPLSYKTKAKMFEVRPRTSEVGPRPIGPRPIDYLILDGNFFIDSEIRQEAVIGADGKIFSCMAAGIIAKVTRDRMMKLYDKKYPQYGFLKHKGYGTKAHYQAIKKYGICPLHRKSFRLLKRK